MVAVHDARRCKRPAKVSKSIDNGTEGIHREVRIRALLFIQSVHFPIEFVPV